MRTGASGAWVRAWIALVTSGCASAGAFDPDIVMMSGPATGTRGSPRTGVVAMTSDELAQCATLIRHLDAQRQQIDRESAAIAGERSRVDRLGDSLDAARPRIDVRNRVAVAAFNRRLDEHQSAVRSFNATVDRHNASTSAVNTLRNVFNASCARRAYRRSHLLALAAPLRQAIEQHSVAGDVPLRTP